MFAAVTRRAYWNSRIPLLRQQYRTTRWIIGARRHMTDYQQFDTKSIDDKESQIVAKHITPLRPLTKTLYNPSGVHEWRQVLEAKNDEDTEEGRRSVDLSQLYDPKLHLPSAPTDWSGYEPATRISDELTARIAVTGRPISIAEYMDIALLHPTVGYYTRAKSKVLQETLEDDEDPADAYHDENQDILHADFLTSPEITSLFGESLGVWFMTFLEQNNGLEEPYQFLECGPGTGQLMVDLLSVCFLRRPPEAIHFIEQSPILRSKQREMLKEHVKHTDPVVFPFDEEVTPETEGIRVYWHTSIAEYRAWSRKHETIRTLVVAQEFLDALPVYCFEKTAEGTFRERLVDVALRNDLEQELIDEQKAEAKKDAHDPPQDPEPKQNTPPKSEPLKPRLRMVLAPEVTPPLKTLLPVDEEGRLPNDTSPPGTIIEVCPQAIIFAQDVAQIVAETGGAALLIDYGDRGSRDSIRGYARHEQRPFLSQPGLIDITADVDFAAILHAVNNTLTNTDAVAYGPLEQGQFLTSMGLGDRVVSVMEMDSTSEQNAEDLCAAYMRLVSSEEMGSRYKVVAIVPKGDTPPPFELTKEEQAPSDRQKVLPSFDLTDDEDASVDQKL